MLATSVCARDRSRGDRNRLSQPRRYPPALSLVEQPAENDGVAGARLAIEDNNTTGKFLNQHFTLEELRLKDVTMRPRRR